MADENNETEDRQKDFPCLHYGCSKSYSSKSSRSNHMKKCYHPKKSPRKKIKLSATGEKDKYKCKNCTMVFKHTSSLFRHRCECNASRLSEGKEPIPEKPPVPTEFTCTTCFAKFDRSGKLDRHMKSKHMGENDRYCNNCWKKFKRRDFFEKHILTCESTQSQPELEETLGELPSFATSQELHSVDSPDQFQSSSVEIGDFPSFVTSEELHSIHRPCTLETDDENEEPRVEDGDGDGDVVDMNVGEKEVVAEEEHFTRDNSFQSSGEIPIVIPSDFTPDLNSTASVNPFTTNYDESEVTTLLHNNSTVEQLGSPMSSDDNDDYSDDNDEYCNLLCEGVLSDLKKHTNNSDYLFAKLYAYFGAQLTYDKNLQKWLIKSLGMRKKRFVRRLFKWLQPKISVPKNSKSLSASSRQVIHDAWIDNSTISVDRRDGRDMVRMPMALYKEQYHSIETSLVSSHTNKRKTVMAQAPRYMCHVTTRKMLKIVEEKLSMKVCLGTVHGLRPFFVDCPSDREKLECLCTVCCNARTMFEAIQRRAKKNSMKVHTSITSYFTSGKECTKDRNGYISRPCITGSCDTCSGIVKPEPYPFQKDDVVTYYQFELVATDKLGKNGKPKKKTQRVDYNSVPTSSVVTKLNDMAKRYLLHRFDVSNDKFVWPLIQAQCDETGEHVVHMDYSENLKEKPKKETQVHHFSGEQHSLHCSVVQKPMGNSR